MKPILFAKDETDFTTNGLGRLDCISCKVIEERNGMFELEAEIHVSSAHAMEIEYLSIIGAKSHDGGNIQAFTVYKITKPMNGRFMVYARHLSYRLSDIPCSPFTVAASPQAAANTLAGLKNNALEPCPFNFSTDVTTGNPYTQNVPASIRQRLGGVEGSVLDQFGGEFEFDNWNVKLWKSRGRLSNVTGISLRYGKNITDINQEEEIATTVTGVVPYWIDTDGNNLVTLPEHVVYSDNAANYPYHITQVLDLSSEFEEKPTVTQLRGVANAYVHKDGFGVPKVSIKVSFANLWESEEYKDIAPLERVQLCDEVSVYFEKLGISSIAKVVKTDFDVLKERYNNVEVGSLRTTLAQAVTDRDKDIDTTFIQEMTRVSTAITNATAWLTNANGYVVAVKNTDGSWKELLFMNTNDPQTATQGIRFNNNGIGFWNKATDGGNVLDGPYGTAWTIDGRLGDFADKNFWNIRTGDFSLSASATVGGQTVQQIADAAQAAAEATAAAALATAVLSIDGDIADLQDQIDGNITTWYFDYVPTLNNAPASTWTTDEDKNNHIGDLFYQDSTGYAWRFMLDNTVTPAVYKWIRISDEDIAAALAVAQEAQDTADNKRRIFIAQPTPPYDIGDTWMMGVNGDIKTCINAKTSSQSYSASDWDKLNKYVDSTDISNAVTNYDTSLNQLAVFNKLTNNQANQGIYLQNGNLYINASMIAAGHLLADYIKGGVLSAGGKNNEDGIINVLSEKVYVTINWDGSGYWYGYRLSSTYMSIGNFTLTKLFVKDIADIDTFDADYRIQHSTDGGSTWTLIETGSLVDGDNIINFDFSIISDPDDIYRVQVGQDTTNSTFKADMYITLPIIILDQNGLNINSKFIVDKDGNVFASGDLTASKINVTGGKIAGLSVENSEKGLSFDGIISGAEYYFKISAYGGITIGCEIQNSWWNRIDYVQTYGMLKIDYGSTDNAYKGLLVTNAGNNTYWNAGSNYINVKHNKIIRYINGNPKYASWSSTDDTSDIRAKNILSDLSNDICKIIFREINPVIFTYKDGIGIDGVHFGIIAQDMEEALKEVKIDDTQVVYEGDDGYKHLDYHATIGLEIAGIKHLYEIVEKQQEEIDNLKQEITELRNLVRTLAT